MPVRDKAKWNAWNKRRWEVNKAALDQLKSGPCADCGNKYPPYVMEFDHVPERGKKVANVGAMCGSNYTTAKKVQAELAKCDLVCANCHKVRTHSRRLSPATSSSSNGRVPG